MGETPWKLAGTLLAVVLAGSIWLFRREETWSGLHQTPVIVVPTPPVAGVAPYTIATTTAILSGAAGAAVDGDPRAAWWTPPVGVAALVLDLGSVKSIAALRWYIAPPATTAPLLIELSDDGRTWRAVALPGRSGASGWHELRLHDRGRFVRWRWPTSRRDQNRDLAQPTGLGEVAVYPPPPTPALTSTSAVGT